MTLLTIVQEASDIIGIPRPSSVAGSSDTQVRILYGLAKTEGHSLARRYSWKALETEATHTTLAAESQGTIESIMPGYLDLINGTMWDRTTQVPVLGPLSPSEWQAMKAAQSTGPYYQFRIQNGNLYFYPAPAAGLTVALEYRTKYWCQSSGGTGQETWAADTDTAKLDEHLMTLGLRWRFLQSRGLDYGEAFAQYEAEVNTAMAGDGGKKTLRLDTGERGPAYGLRIPEGSWAP